MPAAAVVGPAAQLDRAGSCAERSRRRQADDRVVVGERCPVRRGAGEFRCVQRRLLVEQTAVRIERLPRDAAIDVPRLDRLVPRGRDGVGVLDRFARPHRRPDAAGPDRTPVAGRHRDDRPIGQAFGVVPEAAGLVVRQRDDAGRVDLPVLPTHRVVAERRDQPGRRDRAQRQSVVLVVVGRGAGAVGQDHLGDLPAGGVPQFGRSPVGAGHPGDVGEAVVAVQRLGDVPAAVAGLVRADCLHDPRDPLAGIEDVGHPVLAGGLRVGEQVRRLRRRPAVRPRGAVDRAVGAVVLVVRFGPLAVVRLRAGHAVEERLVILARRPLRVRPRLLHAAAAVGGEHVDLRDPALRGGCGAVVEVEQTGRAAGRRMDPDLLNAVRVVDSDAVDPERLRREVAAAGDRLPRAADDLDLVAVPVDQSGEEEVGLAGTLVVDRFGGEDERRPVGPQQLEPELLARPVGLALDEPSQPEVGTLGRTDENRGLAAELVCLGLPPLEPRLGPVGLADDRVLAVLHPDGAVERRSPAQPEAEVPDLLVRSGLAGLGRRQPAVVAAAERDRDAAGGDREVGVGPRDRSGERLDRLGQLARLARLALRDLDPPVQDDAPPADDDRLVLTGRVVDLDVGDPGPGPVVIRRLGDRPVRHEHAVRADAAGDRSGVEIVDDRRLDAVGRLLARQIRVVSDGQFESCAEGGLAGEVERIARAEVVVAAVLGDQLQHARRHLPVGLGGVGLRRLIAQRRGGRRGRLACRRRDHPALDRRLRERQDVAPPPQRGRRRRRPQRDRVVLLRRNVDRDLRGRLQMASAVVLAPVALEWRRDERDIEVAPHRPASGRRVDRLAGPADL